MSDVTEARSARLGRLFELYHDRLVRALRARLGRYDWHLAEDLARETWARAVLDAAKCRASDERAFGWLMVIAQHAMADHYRLARQLTTDFAGSRAYSLPAMLPTEETALARIEARRELAERSEAAAAAAHREIEALAVLAVAA